MTSGFFVFKKENKYEQVGIEMFIANKIYNADVYRYKFIAYTLWV